MFTHRCARCLATTGQTTRFVILEGSAFRLIAQKTLLVAFVALLSDASAFAQKPITIPLEILRTGHAAVKVSINGKGPFRLALDTGSPVTFVSNTCAVKVGLLSREEAATQSFV